MIKEAIDRVLIESRSGGIIVISIHRSGVGIISEQPGWYGNGVISRSYDVVGYSLLVDV